MQMKRREVHSRCPAPRETLDHRLRAVVHATRHVRLSGARGAQVDDSTPLGQMRQYGLCQEKRPSAIEIHVFVPFLQGDRLEGRHDGQAGIIDENVDFLSSGPLQDFFDEMLWPRGDRKISLDREGVLGMCRVQCADLVQDGFRFFFEPGEGIVGGDEGSSADKKERSTVCHSLRTHSRIFSDFQDEDYNGEEKPFFLATDLEASSSAIAAPNPFELPLTIANLPASV
jgi:hypothetical protein